MNSTELLSILKAGGQVSMRFKYRPNPSMRPKLIYTLHYADHRIVPIQGSTLTPLIHRGQVWSSPRVGGGYIYRAKDST